MSETITAQTEFTPALHGPTTLYPLTVPWLIAGALLGMALAVAVDDLVPGYAVFVLIATLALTWRQDEPPIFPFVFVCQWLSVTIGFWFERIAGYFPGLYRPGDVRGAALVALTGLLVLAIGIRAAYQGVDAVWTRRGRRKVGDLTWVISNIRMLFLIVVAAYGIDYFWVVNARAFPGLDVALQRVLDLRQILLVALWLEVLRRRSGYGYLWLALLWAFVPRLGAYFSDFKSPLLLLLIAYASTFRPWDRRWWPKSLIAAAQASPVVAVLLLLLLIWQGGLKRETREAIDSGYVTADPIERVVGFGEGVQRELPELFANPGPYVEQLVERLSYITFLSLVLDYVPEREPHAGGELLKLAVANSTMPRFLFPSKPVLASDSYYTRRFAGVAVAEESTSISIGYMAEFYADWGYGGMWISILGYGCWIGLMAAVLRRFNPIPALHAGVLVVVMLAVTDFEHQFVKGFATLNAGVAFTLVLLAVLKPWLTGVLGLTEVSGTRVPTGLRGDHAPSEP